MKTIKFKLKNQSQNYPIIIGKNAINSLSLFFKKEFNQCLLVIDSRVPKKIQYKVLSKLKRKNITIKYFLATEKNKNQKNVNKILDILLKKNFNRNDCLISVGGGITGDVSGFAASIFKRGLKFINIPTTLLSQVDSSIGGKTGINTKQGKNLIGAFYQPHLVISDTNFLTTLPKREIICGYGEILKHSIISNRKFFNFLDKNVHKILNLKSFFIEKAIYESCLIKKKIVEKDEKENDIRKILNFGHTFAHAYEASLSYSKKLNHGEAVILGIMTASKFSLRLKYLNKKDFDLIEKHLNKAKLIKELVTFFSKKDIKKIISFMIKDKKNYSKKINLILLKKIGLPYLNQNFTSNRVELFLKNELSN